MPSAAHHPPLMVNNTHHLAQRGCTLHSKADVEGICPSVECRAKQTDCQRAPKLCRGQVTNGHFIRLDHTRRLPSAARQVDLKRRDWVPYSLLWAATGGLLFCRIWHVHPSVHACILLCVIVYVFYRKLHLERQGAVQRQHTHGPKST